MASKYTPKTQSKGGQIFDALFLLVLVYAALYAPLEMGLTASEKVDKAPATITWESLGQNPTMQAQWEKLGVSAEDAAPMVTMKYDYTIDPVMLVITAVVIVGYFWFLLVWSEKEYREVIAEKFDSDDQ